MNAIATNLAATPDDGYTGETCDTSSGDGRHFKGSEAGRALPCTRCGACCRHLGGSSLFTQLDRGDGICRHLDLDTNLCRIYETRPTICRVADMFGAFEDQLSWAEYVALNQQACRELQARLIPAHAPADS